MALPILMPIDGIGDKSNVCLTLQYKRNATLDVKRHPKYPHGRREPDGEENDSVTSKEVNHTITDGLFICAHELKATKGVFVFTFMKPKHILTTTHDRLTCVGVCVVIR